MKVKKICPHCGKVFGTTSNARKFCRKKCAILAAKKHTTPEYSFLCQWCGQVFTAQRKRKYCSLSCKDIYMSKIGICKKKVVEVPVKITINDIVKNSKKEKLTYGRYVSIHKL